MYNTEELKKLKVAKVKCMTSSMFHTRYFFMQQYKRKFVVNSHHERICAVLDLVLRGKLTNVIFNIAPRYGKTEIAVKNFISHALSLNAAARFIHLSFSDSLALDNSEAVKDIIKSEKFRFMFPEVEIKSGTDSKKKWSTTKGGGVYATSTAGQVTGFGAGKVDEEKEEEFDADFEEEFEDFLKVMEDKENFGGALIIDDPIKPEDAESAVKRERINARWDSTIKNRVNSRSTPKIIMGQRTHPNDLCGYIMKTEGFTTSIEEAMNDKSLWFLLSVPVIDKNGNALWEFKHNIEELKAMSAANSKTFQTQYMQNPQPKEGLMYDDFRTYRIIPNEEKILRKQYIDTADTGSDFLCSIIYDETKTGIYIIDVVYTDMPMTETETLVADSINNCRPKLCKVEGNNGGSGFARNVEKKVRAAGNKQTKFKTFHQGKNKMARINNESATVTNLVYMPFNWENKWPQFYTALTGYTKTGGNLFHDAPDCITGVAENFGKGITGGIAWPD